MNKLNLIMFIAFLGGLLGISPLATDMYTPSLPSVVFEFNSSISYIQLTISLYLLSFAIGQIIWGPLSDTFGRKPIIIIATIIFLLSSLICIFAPNLEILIIARITQGFGASFGQILARSIIRDRYDSVTAPKIMAYSTMLMGCASIIGPNLGAAAVSYLNWRYIFVILTLYSILLLFITVFFLKETIEKKIPSINPVTILKNFKILFLDINFIKFSFSLSLMFGLLFSFISVAPFIFINVYGFNVNQFGVIFSLVAIVFVLGSAIAGKISSPKLNGRIYLYALILATASAAFCLINVIINENPYIFIFLTMLITFSMGFLVPIGFSSAMQNHPRMAGTASTLIGLTQAIFSSFFGFTSAYFFDNSAIPLTIIMFLLTSLALIIYILFYSLKTSQPVK